MDDGVQQLLANTTVPELQSAGRMLVDVRLLQALWGWFEDGDD